MTTNKKVIDFINETKALCMPDNVVWIDGSEEQLEALRQQAVEEKILIIFTQLNRDLSLQFQKSFATFAAAKPQPYLSEQGKVVRIIGMP